MSVLNKSHTRLGLYTLIIIILAIGSSKFLSGPFQKNSLNRFSFSTTTSFVFASAKLSKIVANDLDGKSGEYGVYIEDLSDGEKYGLHQNEIFPAASLYKLYLLAAVLKEVELGNLSLDDNLTATKDHLIQVFGNEDFGYEDFPDTISYSVQEGLERVGRISDNFAAIMLAEKMSEASAEPSGWEKVQAMADSLDATSTIIADPISTSPADIAIFFKKLYQKQIVSESVSNKITDLLLLNQISDRIPSGIKMAGGVVEDIKNVGQQSSGNQSGNSQKVVRIIHKTGELSRIRHDGGIIFAEGHPYLIILMSKDLEFEDDGVATLSNISKDIYKYMVQKKKKS